MLDIGTVAKNVALTVFLMADLMVASTDVLMVALKELKTAVCLVAKTVV